MLDIVLKIAWESWLVLGQMAPYLLFGFLMAGVLSVCISSEFVEKHLGGRGFVPVVKAALLGVPLPLCSCGVIPVSAAFRRHGASRAATTSFLLSTPQTGIDSIAITYSLLGPVIAIFRPIIALATGLLGGLLILLFGEREANDVDPESQPHNCQEACCAGKETQSYFRRALMFGFVVLPRDIGLALFMGIVVAGAIGVFVPHNSLHAYLGGGILAILVMIALGVPLYVCASASVPIAAGLIHMGASPGAALAFLISGPATNAATLATVWKFLGGRAMLLYLLTIVISAIGSGLTLDWFMPTMPDLLPPLSNHVHEAMGLDGFSMSCAIVLLLVVACSYIIRQPTETHNETTDLQNVGGETTAIERMELAIDGMTCSHCAAAVTQALNECPGVATARVDLTTGRATLTGKQLDVQNLIAAVDKLGYHAHLPS